ncbi:PorV/PorQ family protein [Ekhidna sp.]
MKVLSLTIFFFLIHHSHAQIGTFNLGGRNAGMAGASITLGDEFSLFNNIGGIGRIESHAAFVSYQSRYGIKQFQEVGAGAIYASEIGNAGLGFYKFGDDIYSEQRLHLAFGNEIQMISLAVAIDLLQYHISSIGTKKSIALQLGGIVTVTPEITLGAHIFNLNQAKLDLESPEHIPTVMKGGVSYRPSDELMLNLEVEKDLDFVEIFKAGIEYQLIKDVFVRTGVSTNPFIGAAGIGIHPKNLKFDYGYSSDEILGSIHDFSIAYTPR